MKISLNQIKFLNQHYGCARNPYEYGIDEILHKIGVQLGAVEDVEYTGKKYDGIVVAKVVTCVPHDNSDHLNVCMVDDGGVVEGVERNKDGLVQVVCGAPNVAAGQTVAWIPPNAIVPSSVPKDPFTLTVREIRGKVSNGMLASPAELGISDDHDGILEINVEDVGEDLIRPGTPFKQLYGLDDVIIDLENKMFTHRPDCFGTLGVAREIAGIFGDTYTSPEWYKNVLDNEQTAELSMSVDNQISELVPRFMMQAVADVEVKESPMWLQAYLARIGAKSIYNIVDYTNYYMMLTAQPTHAFDYDKVVKICGDNPVFAPRMAKNGEKIALLNGKTVELTNQDMVITANDKAIALAGVMGGSETEVDSSTKNIVIECATFDMYAVRRTSMRHGLFTDAVTRFTKGQSPLQNDRVLAKIVDEIVRFANGQVASKAFDNVDCGNVNIAHDGWGNEVVVTAEFINSRLGSDLTKEQIVKMLENVEFGHDYVDDQIKLYPPFFRMDIEIPEDIVEEVGRLFGYDKLPVVLPPRSSKPAKLNDVIEFSSKLRSQLSEMGANEVLTYSFVHDDLLAKIGINSEKNCYHLRNAISPDLQYYRPSLIPSLLAKVHANIKSQAGDDKNEFALFEIGKAHEKGQQEIDEPELPRQMRRLSFVYAADAKSSSNKGSAYYQAKLYLDKITNNQAEYLPLDTNEYAISAPFQQGRAAVVEVNGQMLGVVGEFRQLVRNKLKLPEHCAGFEIDIDLLREQLNPTKYKPLSTFPSTHQDITLETSDKVNWSALNKSLSAELAVQAAESNYSWSLTPLDIYQTEGSDKKRFSFRVELADYKKTMKTEEVNEVLDQLAKEVKEQFDAKRI